jgi:hypothetical protein
MAKYYTEQESIPCFAVTYVTNNKTQRLIQEAPNKTASKAINEEDKPLVYAGVYTTADQYNQQQEETRLVKTIKVNLLALTSSRDRAEDVQTEINEYRKELADLRALARASLANTITVPAAVDKEILLYSNVQICPTSNPQVWFLREAEVEISRDWPVCKAKLIITCQLDSKGNIPPLPIVQNTVDSSNKVITRPLATDDEVRIYAGYKTDSTVALEDLDNYPYSFKYRDFVDASTLSKAEQDTKANRIKQLEKCIEDRRKYIRDAQGSSESKQKKEKDITRFYQEINTYNADIKKLRDELSNTTTKVKEITANKPLAPIFWGFIDTIEFIGSANSVQIIYNLRDRSRILADTKLITLPFINQDSKERGAFEGLRHKTIEAVYKAANGGIYLDNSLNSAAGMMWRYGLDVGNIVSLYDTVCTPGSTTVGADGKAIKFKGDNNTLIDRCNRITDQVKRIDENLSALAKERIKFSNAIEDPNAWIQANAFLPTDVINPAKSKYDPLFHIWTLQPPLVSGTGQTTMQIINKSPFEILTYLQVTEVMPIDFYCSHVNGHFIFGPRVLDVTGLEDPERGNRTYFFFNCIDGIPVAYRNLIKDIRVQESTIGSFNRFTIASADFNNPTNASLTDLVSIVDITSYAHQYKNVPVKQHIISDPKIKDPKYNLDNKEGAAQALALTSASIMAKDNLTVMLRILGDASMCPGEAIRIYNTVLHSKDVFTYSKDATSQSVLGTLYQEVDGIKKNKRSQEGSKAKIADLSAVINKIRTATGVYSDDTQKIFPMYKVRNITHSLKATGADAGYTTKIVAIADIL